MDRIRQTVTTVVTVQPSPRAVQITLRPSAQQQQLPRRSVGFSDDVVDNEHLGKRKSKCEQCSADGLLKDDQMLCSIQRCLDCES